MKSGKELKKKFFLFQILFILLEKDQNVGSFDIKICYLEPTVFL